MVPRSSTASSEMLTSIAISTTEWPTGSTPSRTPSSPSRIPRTIALSLSSEPPTPPPHSPIAPRTSYNHSGPTPSTPRPPTIGGSTPSKPTYIIINHSDHHPEGLLRGKQAFPPGAVQVRESSEGHALQSQVHYLEIHLRELPAYELA